ncbi:MAG: hypothetical protein M0026_08080 [Nocardiopsaceae bacterium]|nr:hypothetical protein [Nocardiopsaceae bacterium]
MLGGAAVDAGVTMLRERITMLRETGVHDLAPTGPELWDVRQPV